MTFYRTQVRGQQQDGDRLFTARDRRFQDVVNKFDENIFKKVPGKFKKRQDEVVNVMEVEPPRALKQHQPLDHQEERLKPESRKGSIENIFRKLKDIKGDFIQVERKLRSAVEAMKEKDKGQENEDTLNSNGTTNHHEEIQLSTTQRPTSPRQLNMNPADIISSALSPTVSIEHPADIISQAFNQFCPEQCIETKISDINHEFASHSQALSYKDYSSGNTDIKTVTEIPILRISSPLSHLKEPAAASKITRMSAMIPCGDSLRYHDNYISNNHSYDSHTLPKISSPSSQRRNVMQSPPGSPIPLVSPPSLARSPVASPLPWSSMKESYFQDSSSRTESSPTIKPSSKSMKGNVVSSSSFHISSASTILRSPTASPLPWASDTSSRSPIPWSPSYQARSPIPWKSSLQSKSPIPWDTISDSKSPIPIDSDTQTERTNIIRYDCTDNEISMNVKVVNDIVNDENHYKKPKHTIKVQRNSSFLNSNTTITSHLPSSKQTSDIESTSTSVVGTSRLDMSSPLPWMTSKDPGIQSKSTIDWHNPSQCSSPLPWNSQPRSPLLSRSPVPWSSPGAISPIHSEPIKSPISWTSSNLPIIDNINASPEAQHCISTASTKGNINDHMTAPIQRNSISMTSAMSTNNRSVKASPTPHKFVSHSSPCSSPYSWESLDQAPASIQRNFIATPISLTSPKSTPYNVTPNRSMNTSPIPQKFVSTSSPCSSPYPMENSNQDETFAPLQRNYTSSPIPMYPAKSTFDNFSNNNTNVSLIPQTIISRPTTPCASPCPWKNSDQDHTIVTVQRNYDARPISWNSDNTTTNRSMIISPLPQRIISGPTTPCASPNPWDYSANQTSESSERNFMSSPHPINLANRPNNVSPLPQNLSNPTTPSISPYSWEKSDQDKRTTPIQRNSIASPHNYSSRPAKQTANSLPQISDSAFLQDPTPETGYYHNSSTHQSIPSVSSFQSERKHNHHSTHLTEDANSSHCDELNNDCAVTWSYKPSCSQNKPAFDNPRPKSSMEMSNCIKDLSSKPTRNTTYFYPGQARPFSPTNINLNGNNGRIKPQSPIHFEIQKILSLKQDCHGDKTPIKEIDNKEIEEILKTSINESYGDNKTNKEKVKTKVKAATNIQKAVHFDINQKDLKQDSTNSKESTKTTVKNDSNSDRKSTKSKDTSKVKEEIKIAEAITNKRDYGRPIIITRPGPERPITRMIFNIKKVSSQPSTIKEKSEVSSGVRNVPISYAEDKSKKVVTKSSPPTRSKSSRNFEPVKPQLIRRTKSVLPEMERKREQSEKKYLQIPIIQIDDKQRAENADSQAKKKKNQIKRWEIQGRKMKEKKVDSWKFEWAEIDKRNYRGGEKTEEKNVHILAYETKLIEFV